MPDDKRNKPELAPVSQFLLTLPILLM